MATIVTTYHILDQAQLDSIIKSIQGTDWTDILIQLILVGLAAYSGHFFQKVFQRAQERKQKIEAAYKFNECVIYIGSISENISAHIEQLILESFLYENNLYNRLSHRPITGPIEISLTSIHHIELADIEKISKVPDIGKHPDILQAFHRMRYGMWQMRTICKERNKLSEKLISLTHTQQNNDFMFTKYSEVFDRTKKLLSTAESIFDAAEYISLELVKIAKDLRTDIKNDNIKGIKVSQIIESPVRTNLRLRVRDIVDSFGDSSGRFLHIPRE